MKGLPSPQCNSGFTSGTSDNIQSRYKQILSYRASEEEVRIFKQGMEKYMHACWWIHVCRHEVMITPQISFQREVMIWWDWKASYHRKYQQKWTQAYPFGTLSVAFYFHLKSVLPEQKTPNLWLSPSLLGM